MHYDLGARMYYDLSACMHACIDVLRLYFVIKTDARVTIMHVLRSGYTHALYYERRII